MNLTRYTKIYKILTEAYQLSHYPCLSDFRLILQSPALAIISSEEQQVPVKEDQRIEAEWPSHIDPKNPDITLHTKPE